MILRDYETLIVLKPDLTEDDVTAQITAITEMITPNGGAIIEEDRWGKRRLAYTVKKNKYGYYLLLRFSAAAKDIAELERSFRFSETVLKFIFVIFDGSAGRRKETPKEAVAKTEDTEG